MQEDQTTPDPTTNSSPIHVENNTNNGIVRRERPSRACTQRAAARLQAAAEAEANLADKERKRKKAKRRDKLAARLLKDEELDYQGVSEEEEKDEEIEDGIEEDQNGVQCGKVITPLVGEAEESQLPRWKIRSMWELASILNFLNVFRPLLNVKVEFSAEELETALLSPNNMLADIHMPILKAIPPVTRMALGHNTWVTVLCRKLRDWWHWVAQGDLPIVASHGAEVEAYGALDPGVRVVILKALCDIRVEQEDIRNYIDDSIKHGVQLSLFRKQRIGGDSHGISYWYEEDPIVGHRLHREIRKVEVTKTKGKKVPPIPHSSYQWEAVATNLDEFQNVIEKLSSSKSRTEVSVAKKLTNDMLPEIEKVHKRKEKLLKKQHRQALMLDNMINMDDLGAGRSRRDRKPVTYTFDDYDRSINEAIKVTKNRQLSPETHERRDPLVKPEGSGNGTWGGEPSHRSENLSFSAPSPNSLDDELYYDDDLQNETLDRSNRRKQRPQRYSGREFVEAVSDNDAGFDSDDDIVGEVVYDDAYLKSRKRGRKSSSNSEDEEYDLDQENHEEEEEEEEEDEDNLSTSEDSDGGSRFKNVRGRTRRESKLRSANDFRSGLRRSKRATRNRINYRQIEVSESENELKANASEEQNNITDNEEFSMDSQYSEDNDNKQEIDNENQVIEEKPEMVDTKLEDDPPKLTNESDQEEVSVKKRRFLDLNELAPGSGFDDGPTKDEDADE